MVINKYKWCRCKQKIILCVFEVADYEFNVRFYEFKMADSIWLPSCYKISINLVVDPMEYIFIHEKKDVITEKNAEFKFKWKNSSENKKWSATKWRSGEVPMHLLIYKKKSSLRKIQKKVYVNP